MTQILDAPETAQVNPWEFDRKHSAYLEFLVGLRTEILRHTNQDLSQLFQKKAAAVVATGESTPESLEDVGNLMGGELKYKFNRAALRKTQEMMWASIQSGLEPKKAALLEYINTPTISARGGLELDPELETPAYALHDFHLQPGAYYSQDDMAAFVYEWGGKVYFLKTNDDNQTQKALVSYIPKENYQIMVDFGATTGKCAMAVAAAFPESQIWALDIAGHMLKLGYKMAVERGFENIIFSQQNAEHTKFEDNSVDVVTAFILFHEVTPEARLKIVQEAYRILKPGGWFVNGDVTPFREAPPLGRFISSWQRDNNGEPHWITNNLEANLVAEMQDVGFNAVREFGAAVSKLSAKFPWITMGQK